MEMQYVAPMLGFMTKISLLLLAMSTAVCGIATARTLVVSASGHFSGSDVAGPLVAPNGLFSVSFAVDSNPIPLNGTVTSSGFDVPVASFHYMLNNLPVNVTPSEIRFDTLANGGLFDITIGSGLTASDFNFEGVQAFTGTTAAPVFATGQFAISNWTYSDPANFDSQTPASQTASISPAPEPSTVLLISGSLLVLIGRKFRKP
jgi:hypothetical protein